MTSRSRRERWRHRGLRLDLSVLSDEPHASFYVRYRDAAKSIEYRYGYFSYFLCGAYSACHRLCAKYQCATVAQHGGGVLKTTFLGVIAAAALLSTAVFAQDNRNVTVVNGTGYGIKFLGFNNPGDNDWSDNELGSVFANGQSIYVKFNNADKGCVWNFRISWADPGYPDVLWRDVNLCELDKLTLKWDRNTNETSFIGE